MPRHNFTPAETERIRSITAELDPATHELTRVWGLLLESNDWEFVKTYIRREMESSLQMGLLARSVVEFAEAHGLSNERGLRTFMNSTTWLRNFGETDEADERFMAISGPTSDAPLFMAVEALLEIAKDRMFGTVDEEYRILVETIR